MLGRIHAIMGMAICSSEVVNIKNACFARFLHNLGNQQISCAMNVRQNWAMAICSSEVINIKNACFARFLRKLGNQQISIIMNAR